MEAVPEKSLEFFRKTVGDAHVSTDATDLAAYGADWTKIHKPRASVLVKPGSTAEVSAVLAHCTAEKIPVVPSGGRTGLAGGAVAADGEVVLSLDRLKKIHRVDTVGMTIDADAGATTQEHQEAAAAAGLFFPLDLAAKGSCHIGGNIATNAGGVKFIRFAGAREQVLGLEVVLPSGEVLDMNTALRKNNTGYDLRQLFIGSEGTLGIVTRATLRLTPPPRGVQLTLMAVPEFAAITGILQTCNLEGVQITAFEFFTLAAHEIVLKHMAGARSPFQERSPFYVLLEVEQGPAGGEVMEPLLEKIFEKGLITDAVMAQSSAQAKELWGYRENITESIAAHGHVRKNDISLAVDQLDPFIKDLETLLHDAPADVEIVVFGHIGDGNLHINYVAPTDKMDFDEFNRRARGLEERIFDKLAEFRGSISAEHGIGLLKKKDLHYSRTEGEVEWMRRLKRQFDPAGILNPGKIFDL